jgi:hypothetical protein
MNKIPDIYLALGVFLIILGVWLFRPEAVIENMLSAIFGAILGWLVGKRDAEQDQGS